MVETLFMDKDGKLVESITFYVSDAEAKRESLIEYLFKSVISYTKFYELAEKSPYCIMYLWTGKYENIFIGTGRLNREGKGEPIGYDF